MQKIKNSTRITQLALAVLFISLALVSLQAIYNTQNASAITCPDGSTLPDAEASNCPAAPAPTTSPSTSNSYCDLNPSECTPINPGGSVNNSDGTDGKQCGKGDHTVTLSINIGCRGNAFPGPDDVNPIIDMAFALFRFLSAGVGVVVVGSIVVAGIQYTSSRGNPQATEASIKRVTNSVLALVLYVFIFAIANYLVPGGLLI